MLCLKMSPKQFTHSTHLSRILSRLSPQKLLHHSAGYLFVPLATQLVNDTSPLCRQMVAEAIKALLKKVRGNNNYWHTLSIRVLLEVF